MNKMNGKRILLGGFVVALVLILGEVIPEAVIGSSHERWLQEMGLPMPGEAGMVVMTLAAFGFGIVVVWIYGVFSTHFGAGPKTALIAGIAAWTLNCLLPNMVMSGFGALSAGLFWYFTLHDLVVVPVAALAGAMTYRTADVKKGATPKAMPYA